MATRWTKWYGDWNPGSINRPYVHMWAYDDNIGISLSWGNTNSDPVWMIAVEITLPSWIAVRIRPR